MGDHGHAAALLWLGHVPSIDLAIGPGQTISFFQDHWVFSRPFIKWPLSRPLGSFKTIHQVTSFKIIAFFQHYLSCEFFQDHLFSRPFISWHLSTPFTGKIFQDHWFLSRPFISLLLSRPFINWFLSRPPLSTSLHSFKNIYHVNSLKTIEFFQEYFFNWLLSRPLHPVKCALQL